MKIRVFATACLMLSASVLAMPVQAQTSSPTPPAKSFGVYEGNGCTGSAHMPVFAAWSGQPISRVLDFAAYSSWASFLSDAQWAVSCWHQAGYQNLTMSLPMLVSDNVSTLAKGAAGAYTSYYTNIASYMVKAGYANAVIRLGWEFNGNWYPWAAAKDPASFVNYWRVIVTAMRAVPGANFQFDWCSSEGWLSIKQDQVYPGDDVVDIIGMDVYNAWWNTADKVPATRWADLQTASYGLNWLQSFAALHGKPISLPEWATGTRPDGHGGGDDPVFVNGMVNWINTRNVIYSDYWDYNASDYQSQVSKGGFPLSGAALQAGYPQLVATGS